MKNGVSPNAWHDMSLYELESLMRSYSAKKETPPDLSHLTDKWREMGLTDVKV